MKSDTTQTNVNIRTHLLRYFLLGMVLLLAGCNDSDCESPENFNCGPALVHKETVVLTSQKPGVTVQTGPACGLGSCTCTVRCRYRDSTPAAASHPDIPDISLKLGTTEVVRVDTRSEHGSWDSDGYWVFKTTATINPGRESGGKKYVLDCYWKAVVTMARPLLTLPGSKAPIVKLPFIGELLGPKPRDVEVIIQMDYQDTPKIKI